MSKHSIIIYKVIKPQYKMAKTEKEKKASAEVLEALAVWSTQNIPRWQQFHVAPVMSAL